MTGTGKSPHHEPPVCSGWVRPGAISPRGPEHTRLSITPAKDIGTSP
ncbi:hypothetical protein [Streptomyces sp. NPDC086182]